MVQLYTTIRLFISCQSMADKRLIRHSLPLTQAFHGDLQIRYPINGKNQKNDAALILIVVASVQYTGYWTIRYWDSQNVYHFVFITIRIQFLFISGISLYTLMAFNLTTNESIVSSHMEEQCDLYAFIMEAGVTGSLCILGLIGNTIAYNIFGRMKHRNSTTFLLQALAVIDSCVLILGLPMLSWPGFAMYLKWGYREFILVEPYMMKYVRPFVLSAVMATIWTCVLIGVNRYIAVCKPFKANTLCTLSKARKQLICIVLFSLAFPLPRIFEVAIKTADNSTQIILSRSDMGANQWYRIIYYFGCDAVFRYLLPFTVSLFIAVRLCMALRTTQQHSLVRHGRLALRNQVTRMLTVLQVVFLACHTPPMLARLLSHLYSEKQKCGGFLFYMHDITDTLIIFNSSLNCLIYIIFMSEFRRTLCGMRHRDSAYSSIYSNSYIEKDKLELMAQMELADGGCLIRA